MRLDRRLAAAGIMGAVFVSGGITGGVLARTVLDERPFAERRWDGDRRSGDWRGDRGPEHGPERGPDRGRRSDGPREPRGIISSRTLDILAERLELGEAQRDSVELILERGRERASAVFDDVGPRLRSVLDTTYEEIRGTLDPAQQAEFDVMIQEDRGVLGRQYVPSDSTRGG